MIRPRRSFSGRREVAIGLGVYAAYLLARQVVIRRDGRAKAARNAATDRRARAAARASTSSPRSSGSCCRGAGLCHVLNVGYVTLNVVLTVGLPMLLYVRRDPRYHWMRRAVGISILGASPVFLAFPCDPPRTLDGFQDTIKDVSGLDLDSGLVAQLYNPIAAFPSIHMAFAVVTAAGIRATSENPALRGAAAAYPPAVAFTIFATANHYVLDAVAGTALGLAAVRVSRALER